MKHKILLALGVLGFLCLFDTRTLGSAVEYNKYKQDIHRMGNTIDNQKIAGLFDGVLDQLKQKVQDIITPNQKPSDQKDVPDETEQNPSDQTDVPDEAEQNPSDQTDVPDEAEHLSDDDRSSLADAMSGIVDSVNQETPIDSNLPVEERRRLLLKRRREIARRRRLFLERRKLHRGNGQLTQSKKVRIPVQRGKSVYPQKVERKNNGFWRNLGSKIPRNQQQNKKSVPKKPQK